MKQMLLVFATIATCNLFAATLNLNSGEEVTLSPNTLTTVTCNGNGGSGTKLICACLPNSYGMYRIYHDKQGSLTDAIYSTRQDCTKDMISAYALVCIN